MERGSPGNTGGRVDDREYPGSARTSRTFLVFADDSKPCRVQRVPIRPANSLPVCSKLQEREPREGRQRGVASVVATTRRYVACYSFLIWFSMRLAGERAQWERRKPKMKRKEKRSIQGRTSLFRGGCCGINSVESRRAGREGDDRRETERNADWQESVYWCAYMWQGGSEKGKQRERRG